MVAACTTLMVTDKLSLLDFRKVYGDILQRHRSSLLRVVLQCALSNPSELRKMHYAKCEFS
jgi:hypothetical protein